MSTWAVVVVLALVVVGLLCALAELSKKHQALQTRQAELYRDYQVLRAQYQEAQRILAFKRTLTNRLEVSKRECYDRLRQLGFESLEQYQQSELWLKTKQRYRSSDYPQRCLVCGASDFELHHRTYARLGEEELFDLVPLCSVHHKQLHELLDSDRTACVKDTHDYLALLVDMDRPDTPDEQAPAQGTSGNTKQQRSRAGKPWSAEEDAELLRCFDRKLTKEQMADRLHRGVRAIEVRLFKLGRLTLEEGGRGWAEPGVAADRSHGW
jgi:hypothetical protein